MPRLAYDGKVAGRNFGVARGEGADFNVVPSHAGIKALAVALRSIAGCFILSVNDVLETCEIFADFRIEEARTHYTIAGEWSDAREIVVMGPRPDDPAFVKPRDLLSLKGRVLRGA